MPAGLAHGAVLWVSARTQDEGRTYEKRTKVQNTMEKTYCSTAVKVRQVVKGRGVCMHVCTVYL